MPHALVGPLRVVAQDPHGPPERGRRRGVAVGEEDGKTVWFAPASTLAGDDGVTGLMALQLDPSALGGVELIDEDSYGSGQVFPHAYGPVPTSAVVGTAGSIGKVIVPSAWATAWPMERTSARFHVSHVKPT